MTKIGRDKKILLLGHNIRLGFEAKLTKFNIVDLYLLSSTYTSQIKFCIYEEALSTTCNMIYTDVSYENEDAKF